MPYLFSFCWVAASLAIEAREIIDAVAAALMACCVFLGILLSVKWVVFCGNVVGDSRAARQSTGQELVRMVYICLQGHRRLFQCGHCGLMSFLHSYATTGQLITSDVTVVVSHQRRSVARFATSGRSYRLCRSSSQQTMTAREKGAVRQVAALQCDWPRRRLGHVDLHLISEHLDPFQH